MHSWSKLLVLLQLHGHPLLQPDAGLDTTAYVELAQRVVGGDPTLGPGLYFVSPLYIYFLAAGLALFDSFTAVRVLQIILGASAVACIFVTARIWFGERAGLIAGVLATLTGLFTFYEVLILQASIDAFLTAAALLALAQGTRAAAPSRLHHVWCGVRRTRVRPPDAQPAQRADRRNRRRRGRCWRSAGCGSPARSSPGCWLG